MLKIKNRKASPRGPRIEVEKEEPKQLIQANLKESVSSKPIRPQLHRDECSCGLMGLLETLIALLSGEISSTVDRGGSCEAERGRSCA